MITASCGDSEPVATVFGIPFDSTHSYKPGCRFGPDVIRDAFNNIEIFHPQFGIDLETLDELLLDMSIERCAGCGWYDDCFALIPDGEDDPDGQCSNCRG